MAHATVPGRFTGLASVCFPTTEGLGSTHRLPCRPCCRRPQLYQAIVRTDQSNLHLVICHRWPVESVHRQASLGIRRSASRCQTTEVQVRRPHLQARPISWSSLTSRVARIMMTQRIPFTGAIFCMVSLLSRLHPGFATWCAPHHRS